MDHLWVAAERPGPALLHRVAPASGLTGADLAALAGWVASVT
ncbi:hypothetical protein [Streptomyces sp. CRN 30]